MRLEGREQIGEIQAGQVVGNTGLCVGMRKKFIVSPAAH